MSNPGLNELFVFLCLAVITAAPFYFRAWLAREQPLLLEPVDRKTNRLSLLIFAALFAGAFLYPRHSWKVAQVLLGASILSFSILYQTRGRYVLNLSGRSSPTPQASLRQSAARMGIGLALCGIFSLHPLLILTLPFALPFLMPVFLRLQHATAPLEPSPLRESIETAFRKEGLTLSGIRLIDEPTNASKNAFISGSGFGRGIFGRTLFIGLELLSKLDEEELRAVVLHEAAHVKAGHSGKRLFSALLLTLLSTFWIVIPAVFLFPGDTGILLASALIALLTQAFLFARIVHRQELEADLEAVRMGAGSDALGRALLKLDAGGRTTSKLERLLSGNPYPSIEERIQALRDGIPEEAENFLPAKSFLSAYSMLVIGIVLWSAQDLAQSGARTPAAAVSHPAKIARSAESSPGR
jgi:Zn-dependent protease with chaperone function